ncbi:ATP-binding cassette domain-containing protein [Pseudonocardiaceae bacterium YIM PH 21723]|nr:ATP-binding cassette domain-containing protein [Pseudonocardiaceae bacterium YIM PH 21723]
MTEYMIEVDEVSKTFGEVTAVDGVSLYVPRGTVTGLLGHNGAGKTTLVNVLSTVLPVTSGSAKVAGFDVTAQAAEVRRRIGLTGQFAAVDELLTGHENLVLIARLLGASGKEARQRADELLEIFDLTDAAHRKAKTYSGGMKRRLDLASSLIGHPQVIFLDEPTTGLDPIARTGLWEVVENLVADGTTVLLTTQYLDEADRLADSITVLSEGSVVASGTAAELKAQVGSRTVAVKVADRGDTRLALLALTEAGLHPVHDEERHTISAPATASTDLAVAVRALDAAHIEVAELALTEPTLDDVYLNLNAAPAA